MLRLVTLVALCSGIAACATNTTPGTTASAWDGAYKGKITSTHVAALSCASVDPRDGALTVEKGAVVWPAGADKLYAPIKQDGSFAAQNGTVFLTGKLADSNMVARINTGSCHQTWQLTKAG